MFFCFSLIRSKMNDQRLADQVEHNLNRLITARDIGQTKLDYPTLAQCCLISPTLHQRYFDFKQGLKFSLSFSLSLFRL